MANLYYLHSSDQAATPGAASLAAGPDSPGWEGLNQMFAAAQIIAVPGWSGAAQAIACPGLAAPGFVCGQVSSAFDVAWVLDGHNQLPCWGFVLAAEQSAGRGQLRRAWQSPPGNLHVVFRLPEELGAEAGALLTGYLLHRALARLGADLALKWPNDLLQDNQKIGGILLEERGGVVLAGFGLNLKHAPGPADLAGDGAQAPRRAFAAGVLQTPKKFSQIQPPQVLNVWLELVKQITLSYEQDLARRPLGQKLAVVEKYLAFKGEVVTVLEPGFSDADFLSPGSSLSGRIAGLGPKGELRLLLSSGAECLLHSGTLSLEK